MTARHLHLVTERISSLLRSSLRQVASSHSLKLVQLEALVYLSVANRYSDTPIAVTEYLGVTKGTVSQTLKVLERQALIEKHTDQSDRRVQHCVVTNKGQAIVAEALPSPLFHGSDTATQSELLAASLNWLLQLQQLNGFRTFGQCRSCQLYQPLAKGGRCGLTEERLSVADGEKRCREHQLATPLQHPAS